MSNLKRRADKQTEKELNQGDKKIKKEKDKNK